MRYDIVLFSLLGHDLLLANESILMFHEYYPMDIIFHYIYIYIERERERNSIN